MFRQTLLYAPDYQLSVCRPRTVDPPLLSIQRFERQRHSEFWWQCCTSHCQQFITTLTILKKIQCTILTIIYCTILCTILYNIIQYCKILKIILSVLYNIVHNIAVYLNNTVSNHINTYNKLKLRQYAWQLLQYFQNIVIIVTIAERIV